jgi:hypothetical protein
VSADERLRAAKAGVAERARLVEARPQLAAQLAHQEQIVAQHQGIYARKQAEVDRLARNVGTFLNELLGGRSSRDEQEALEAAARLNEAHTAMVALREQLAQHDARIAQLASAPLDLAAARADKEKELGPRATAALQDLEIQVMAIDIELAPLQDAITKGTTALAAVVDLANGLDEIATLDESRKIVKATRARAAETEDKLRVFEQSVDELAIGLELPRETPGDADLSAWTDALFLRGDLQQRIAAARAELGARIDRIRPRIAAIEARHREVSARRSALFGQRDELIDEA